VARKVLSVVAFRFDDCDKVSGILSADKTMLFQAWHHLKLAGNVPIRLLEKVVKTECVVVG